MLGNTGPDALFIFTWDRCFIECAHRLWAELRGRIGIIITHRFPTALFADVIHVMAAGQVVESGNHEQLLAAAGLYAQGWAAQARA